MNEIQTTQPKRDYFLPASILISALLISVSLIYNAGKKAPNGDLEGNLVRSAGNKSVSIELEKISSDDHLFGSSDAPVKVVEFSDFECPFCKQFHETMHQIVKDYDGRVAWIYRQFPIDELHPRARKESEASECAAELGGNSKFWEYADKIFEVTPSNNGLDPKELYKIAEQVGLDRSKFTQCLESGRNAARVEADVNDAIKAGALGTPYSVVVSKDGKKYPINGALSYTRVKSVIDEALR